MGFLDEIKKRFPFGPQHQSYDQGDDYDDDYYDAPGDRRDASGRYDDRGYRHDETDYADDAASDFVSGYQDDSASGVLGQTRRGEAESVAVYTRSGKLIGDGERHATTFNPPARSQESFRTGAYDTPSSYAGQARSCPVQPSAARVPASSPSSSADQRASSILNAVPQLPVYILRPESYEDVETVVRRVRTKQPVALVFAGVRTEVAKRVLDFSYGFACGLGASVREVGDRVFVVLPQGCEIKKTDLAKLRTDGYLK